MESDVIVFRFRPRWDAIPMACAFAIGAIASVVAGFAYNMFILYVCAVIFSVIIAYQVYGIVATFKYRVEISTKNISILEGIVFKTRRMLDLGRVIEIQESQNMSHRTSDVALFTANAARPFVLTGLTKKQVSAIRNRIRDARA